MYQTLHKNLLALGDINFLVGIQHAFARWCNKMSALSFYYHFFISAIYCRQKYSVLQVLLN